VRGILERVSNDLEDGVRVFQGLVVPEAEDTHAAVDEAPLSLLVMGGLLRDRMATSVKLDCEAGFGTVEVDDEAGDRMLPAEFPSIQPAVTEARPEANLRVGGDVAHAASPFFQFRTLTSQTPLDQ
jgi:hypothetical protein